MLFNTVEEKLRLLNNCTSCRRFKFLLIGHVCCNYPGEVFVGEVFIVNLNLKKTIESVKISVLY
jgi:hypothetical protein